MHRFLRAAGFSMYQKKKDIRALLRCLAREAGTSSCLQLDRETELYEIKTEVAPGIGVAICGSFWISGYRCYCKKSRLYYRL